MRPRQRSSLRSSPYCTPLPHMVQAPRVFRGLVGGIFQAVDAEAPIPEFLGSMDGADGSSDAVREERRLGDKWS